MSGHFCSSRRRSSSSRLSRLSFHSGRFSDLSSRSSRLVNSMRPSRLARVQQLPENLRRQAADQVLAVDEDALVGGVVDDLAPTRRVGRGWSGRGRGRQPARQGAPPRSAPRSGRARAAPCSESRSRDSCRAARSRSCPLRGSGTGTSLSRQSTPTSSPRTSSGTPSWLSGAASPGSGIRRSSGQSPCSAARRCTAKA